MGSDSKYSAMKFMHFAVYPIFSSSSSNISPFLSVDAIYKALSVCQTLHPDPEQEEDEDDWTEGQY